MEMYNEMENDAGDAYPHDATAGVAGHEHEGPNYDMQMVRHIEEEEDADRGDLVGMGVFKPTSGNATKRLRVRQETRGTTRTTTTRAGKAVEAVIKQAYIPWTETKINPILGNAPKKYASRYYQLKVGHGAVGTYLTRIGVIETPECWWCKEVLT